MQLFENATDGGVSAEIAQRFAKFGFKCVVIGAATADAALAKLAGIGFNLSRQHPRTGTDQVIQKQSLLDLLEIATHNAGAVVIVKAGSDVEVRGAIEISDVVYGGSLNPVQDEKYKLTLSGIPNDVKVTCHSIEYPGNAQFTYDYNPVGILKGAPSPINVASAKYLALLKSELVQLELVYTGGAKAVFLPEEINQLMIDSNHTCYNKMGLITAGGGNLFVMDVGSALSANVTYANANSAYLVRVNSVG